MLKGFKEFITRGNALELAVGVVIGGAFTAIVNAIVENLINPLVGVIFNAEDLQNSLVVSVPTVAGGHASLKFGAILGAVISFLVIASVVYFVFVHPMNKLRQHAEEIGLLDKKEDEDDEVSLLTEIRDLLNEASHRGRQQTHQQQPAGQQQYQQPVQGYPPQNPGYYPTQGY